MSRSVKKGPYVEERLMNTWMNYLMRWSKKGFKA